MSDGSDKNRVSFRAEKLFSTLVMIVVISAILAIGAFTSTILLADRYWLMHCPTTTFLWGHLGSTASEVLTLPLLFIIIFCLTVEIGGSVIRLFYGRNIPIARHFSIGFGNFTRRWRWLNLGLLALFTIIFCLNLPSLLNNYYCLSPSGLVDRSSARRSETHYRWSDVNTFKTACAYVEPSHEVGYWSETFSLVMTNGDVIDAGGQRIEGTSLDPRYLKLAAALHGLPVKFDNSDVENGCHPTNIKALSTASAKY
jgi:hypothetical protein